MKKLKDNLIFAAKFVVILIPLLLVAALPTTLNTGQFNTFGPLSVKSGALATNVFAFTQITATNDAILRFDNGSSQYNWQQSVGELKLFDGNSFNILVFDQQDPDLTINYPILGESTGNDIKTHERFQFCNRADTAVTSGDEVTLINATASGSLAVSASYLTQGAQIIVEMGGTTANGGGGATITNRVYLDGTNIATGVINAEGTSRWNWRSTTTIRTTGASGTFKTTGALIDSNNSGITHPSGSGNIDTTVSHTLNVTVQSAPDQTAETLLITILRP